MWMASRNNCLSEVRRVVFSTNVLFALLTLTFVFMSGVTLWGCGTIEEEGEHDGGNGGKEDSAVQKDGRVLPDAAVVYPTECSRLDLIIQNECGSGRRCTIVSGEPFGGNAEIGCTAPGSVTAGGNCTPTLPNGPDDCEAGSVCADLFGTGNYMCRPFCESLHYGYCEDGLCGVPVTLADDDDILLCIPDTPCDPVYDSGCLESLSCYWTAKSPEVTTCLNPGSREEESPCSIHAECQPMHTCYGEPGNMYCRWLCESPPTGFCPDGDDCVNVGSDNFGVCLP